jgi:hypothetical protein
MATGGTVTGRTTSLTFWWTMTAIDLALVLLFAVLAWRARVAGRDDRHRRFTRAVWGFSAYAALCFARIILLTK